MMVAVKEERSIEEGLLKLKNQNGASDCRITACVFLSTFVAICGSFSFGVSLGYTSGAEVGMIKDMGLSIAEFSAFGSFSTLGATFGALFSGKMAIMLGRKGVTTFLPFHNLKHCSSRDVITDSRVSRMVLMALEDWYVRTLTPTGSSPSANIISGKGTSISPRSSAPGSPVRSLI